MKSFLALSILFLLPSLTIANDQYETDYLERKGNPKALAHLRCIMNTLEYRSFRVKKSGLVGRCNSFSGNKRRITVENKDIAVIVDYTKTSDKRRFYILDLKNNKTRYYFTSHGRFGNTNRANTRVTSGSNSVKQIEHFSNRPGSNASSSGLHITGHSYVGKWSGPTKKKRSMVLHGIERGINDNSCSRATVIHGNSYIKETGKAQGVGRMSSGCPMLDYNIVDRIIDKIRGKGGYLSENKHEKREGGAFYFVYGPREAALPDDYYCDESNLKMLSDY